MKLKYLESIPHRIEFSSSNTVSNRVIVFGNSGPDLIFIPGWASTEFTWRKFIPYLATKYRIHYFESREKPFTKYHSDNIDFSIKAMAQDLANYANNLDHLDFIVGASLGTTILIYSWETLKIKPEKIALICPSLNVQLPYYFKFIRIIPESLVYVLRPLVLWAIFNFSFRADSERIAGLVRAMNAGDVKVLRKSAAEFPNLNITDEELNTINVPTLIIGTLKDEIHDLSEAKHAANQILNSKLEHLQTFKLAHSSRCAQLIDEWLIESSFYTRCRQR